MEQSMETYRAYIVDDDKTFKNFQEFKAEDDDAAAKIASEIVNGHAIELWQNARVVGKLRPTSRSAV